MDERKEICDKIAEDAKNDAASMDGQLLNGRTVAKYFGYHGASIAALADLVKSVIEDNEKLRKELEDKRSVATEAK